MCSSGPISVPLKFNQLVELVKSLPQKQKSKLMVALQRNDLNEIPNWQKEEVNRRIKKYDDNPELLVADKEALKMIKEF